ncbi:MAG: hypothetical protein AAF545_06115 [Pseudomonadota bacterium]
MSFRQRPYGVLQRTLVGLMLVISQAALAAPVTVVPASVSKDCHGGVARIYDECSDQSELLAEALQLANASGKTVLILYGAEWCIWCHVFDKYVKGQSRRFKYQWQFPDGYEEQWDMRERENRQAEAQAKQLNEYVAENFVIFHLEYYFSPNGEAVLASTGFDAASVEVVPQVLVVDGRGTFVAGMDDYSSISNLEVREDSGREYRGFDRPTLLRELVALREAALAVGSGE